MIQNKPKGRKLYHVVQRPDRMWEVRKMGQQISLHGSDVQAIDYALQLANAGQGIEIRPRKRTEVYPG